MVKGKDSDSPPTTNTKIIYRRKHDEIFGIDSGLLQWAGIGAAIFMGASALMNSLKKGEEQQQPQEQPPQEQQSQVTENEGEPQIQQDTPNQQPDQAYQAPMFTTDSVRNEVINKYKSQAGQPVFNKRMSIA